MKNVRLSLFTNGSKLALALLLTGTLGFGIAIHGSTRHGGATGINPSGSASGTGGKLGRLGLASGGGVLTGHRLQVNSGSLASGIGTTVTGYEYLHGSLVGGAAIYQVNGSYHRMGQLGGANGVGALGLRDIGGQVGGLPGVARDGEPPGAFLHTLTGVIHGGTGLTLRGLKYIRIGTGLASQGILSIT